MNVAIVIDHHNNDKQDNFIYSNNANNKDFINNDINKNQISKNNIISNLEQKINELNNSIEEQNNRLEISKKENEELENVIKSYKDYKGEQLIQKQLEKEKIKELLNYLEASLKNVGISEEDIPLHTEQKNTLNTELENIETQIIKLQEELQ